MDIFIMDTLKLLLFLSGTTLIWAQSLRLPSVSMTTCSAHAHTSNHFTRSLDSSLTLSLTDLGVITSSLSPSCSACSQLATTGMGSSTPGALYTSFSTVSVSKASLSQLPNSHSPSSSFVYTMPHSHTNPPPQTTHGWSSSHTPSVHTMSSSHTSNLMFNSTVVTSAPPTALPPSEGVFPLKYQLILYTVVPLGAVVCCLICLALCLCTRRYRRIRRIRRQLIPLTDRDGSDESDDEEELDNREPVFMVTPMTRPMLAFANT